MNKENADLQLPKGNFSKGFGEITYTGMKDVINLLSTRVPFTKDSLFLDIGCGLGQPVYHAAIELGINATGVEIVPLHVENAKKLRMMLDDDGYFEGYKGVIDIILGNIEIFKSIDCTHIYSYNYVFTKLHTIDIIRIFEDVERAEALIFNLCPKSAKKYGLVNAVLVG